MRSSHTLPPLARPPRLQPGDPVGVVAPASPLEPHQRQVVERSIRVLEKLELRPMEAPGLWDRRDYLAGTDKARARQLQWALEEDEIHGVFCLRGGYGSMRILPLLEPEFLQKYPKVFVGFSDLTALLLHLLLQGRMVTFHGPTLSHEDLARGPESLTARSLTRVVIHGEPPEPLRGEILREGMAEGPLVGGCLSLISALVGTPYAPRFSGCIGFFEDTGEPPYRIDRMLLQLRLSGALDGIRGIVLGPFRGGIPPSSLRKTFLDALAPLEVPILCGIPSGHGEISFTMPLGVPVRLDAREGLLTFVEAGVSHRPPETTAE